jgi:crossover junction endodeoxyribonuclease RusA
MTTMRSLSLPYPPSANRLWRAWKGRNIKSAEYRAWLTKGAADLAGQEVEPVPGHYRLTLIVNRPDNRRRDLSNTIKPVEDLLQSAGLIRDDADCQRLMVMWGSLPPDKAARVLVHLTPCRASQPQSGE